MGHYQKQLQDTVTYYKRGQKTFHHQKVSLHWWCPTSECVTNEQAWRKWRWGADRICKEGQEQFTPAATTKEECFRKYKSLTLPKRDVLHQIQNHNLLKGLEHLRIPEAKKNKNKYCHYHCNYDHDTKEYFKLKKEIKAFIC